MGEEESVQTCLEACRDALGVTSSRFDEEISLSIAAAKLKMEISGVHQQWADDDADPLVRVAIIAFVKGSVGNDNPDAQRFMESFESFVTHMKLTCKYTQPKEASDG